MNRDELIADIKEAESLGDQELTLALLEKLDSLPKGRSWEDVPGEAVKNLPKSIQGVGENVINSALHPIDTTQALLDMANGLMQKALPEQITQFMPERTKRNEEKVNQIVDFYKSRYGSEEDLKNAIATDPAGVIMDLSTLVSGVQGISKATGISDFLKKKALQSEANAARTNALNAPTAAILREGQEAGYVVPPSTVNPSFMNKRLESIAGKAATGQQAAINNQDVTNALVRQELGIGADVPVRISNLDDIRRLSGQSYENVANMPTPPSLAHGYSINSSPIQSSRAVLDELKQVRNDAQGWYKAYQRSASPDDLKKYHIAEKQAENLDSILTDRAKITGNSDLMNKLYESRKRIAKTSDIENALNTATGNISAPIIGGFVDKAPKKYDGNLKTIGEFQQTFPLFMREAEKVPSPGVSKVEALAGAAMAGAGAANKGPSGLLYGGLPLVSGPVRDLILSKPYQKAFAKIPKEKSSSLLRRAASITEPEFKQLLVDLMYQAQEKK